MQDGKENLLSPNASSSANELVSQKAMKNRPVLFPLYHQQIHNINHMLKDPMTEEMCTQSNLFQVRGAMCINFIEEAMVKNQEMEIRNREMEINLKKAIADAEFWKKCSHDKTALCHELASRLLILKKNELRKKRAAERDFEEKVESSSGDNGDDEVDTASTMMCKRRRI